MLKDKLNRIFGGGIVKKFIIWTVAIIIILDVLTTIYMQIDMDSALSEQLNEKGQLLSRHLAEESSGLLSKENTGDLHQLAVNIKNSDEDVVYVYITDANNNVLAHTFNGSFPDELLATKGTGSLVPEKYGDVIDFKAPRIGKMTGFVHVGMNRRPIDKKIAGATRINIANILIEGVLGLMMASIAGNYLTKPIRTLVKGAEEIGRGNLGYKIETSSNDDEIQTLSNAFNQMSNSLHESISELRKLSVAVEEAPDGIRITDLEGYIIYSNKATENILGFSPDELKGKHVTELNIDPDIGSKVILPSIKANGRWNGELIQKRKDGKEIPLWLSASIVKDRKGEPIAMVGIIKDITDQKEKEQLEKQLLQADKLATIGQLAAGVAHEINNPLGNISLYTQMLLKKTENGNTKEKLTIINDETNRAAQIVKELLDFARQSEPKLTLIDINKKIEKVLGIMTPQLKDIKVTTELEPIPRICADSGQIQQVIINLLKNSIQSITKEGEIMIKTAAKNDYVEISISDNGCGIPKEDLNKIFDPFFTTKEMGKGTGLGLSISYGIIKRHNGSIEVKSNIRKGTKLTIKLPV
ncbi:MAG: ATP-binding protein [Candidatus Methanoperedens sp.]|nr:ATP-binding protein [Candidatus Methanoperedens sp.]MCZ7404021.1 ATP-binding protein [Candidatus Methanoperedens sp.]